MNKRVFIIHRWGGYPGEGWFPWLKQKLENTGVVDVFVLQMPNTETPTIKEWVSFLADQVGKPDENTYFVGHSIGCQTIFRYLEKINTQVGGVACVAGWFTLKDLPDEEWPIANPWINTPIDFDNVKKKSKAFFALLSDDDPVVPLEENRRMFMENLGTEPKVEHAKGHFSGEDGVTEIPILLEKLMEMMDVLPVRSAAVGEGDDY